MVGRSAFTTSWMGFEPRSMLITLMVVSAKVEGNNSPGPCHIFLAIDHVAWLQKWLANEDVRDSEVVKDQR